ncbi:MAG: hypothetical protein V1809_06440 [Planctomycetota bacterium]
MTLRNRCHFRVAPFKVDVTPPVGYPIAYGVNRKVDSPLYVRGVVLDDGRTRAVMAIVDFLGIAGRAHQEWQARIARASGAPPSQVLLHTVHQHDSVNVGLEGDALMKPFGFPPKTPLDYWKAISGKLEAAVRKASGPHGAWGSVSRMATAERRLSGLAANRRLVKDGRVWNTRWSMTFKPEIQREPTGLIDPILRTIGFLDKRGRLIASLHFYATHPQVAYNRHMAGSDVPGVALRHLETTLAEEGAHLYFTGCGADITFGKYTDAVKETSLAVLGRRLGEGLVANVRALEEKPVGPLTFARARFTLPRDKRITKQRTLAKLKKTTDAGDAHACASRLFALRNWNKICRPTITRMSLGPNVHALSLVSEVVVAYQLYAQSLVPEHFLACAAYGKYSYGYLPTAAMYAEGGYEPAAGLYTPAIEKNLKDAIAHVLNGVGNP